MIEPRSPVTIRIRYTPYPALQLPGDDHVKLKPNTIILRHRHLKQQHTVISPRMDPNAAEHPVRKATRGYPVAFLSIPPLSQPLPALALEDRARQGICSAPEQVAPSATATPGPVVSGPGPAPLQGEDVSATTQQQSRGLLETAPRTATRSGTAMAVRAVSRTPAAVPHATGDAIATPQQDRPGQSKRAAVNKSMTPCLVVRRHEHSIRDRSEKTIWFSSRSKEFLDAPVPIDPSRLVPSALFVHTVSGDRQQIWLWVANKWTPIERHHPHPYLPDYVLNILSNGEPSWVTSETVRTYKGRLRKRQREQSSKCKSGGVSA